MQCDCIVLITVQSAKNQVRGELKFKSSFVNPFGVDSSQSQDEPPTPPPRHRKRKLEERHKVDGEYDNRDDDDREEVSKAGDTSAAAVAE